MGTLLKTPSLSTPVFRVRGSLTSVSLTNDVRHLGTNLANQKHLSQVLLLLLCIGDRTHKPATTDLRTGGVINTLSKPVTKSGVNTNALALDLPGA